MALGIGISGPRGGGGGSTPTLTIGVFSDAGHTTPITNGEGGDTIYILATGITATNYVFWAYNPTTEESVVIDDEGTGAVSWVLPYITKGDWEIRCDAKNGTSDLVWGYADFEVTMDADVGTFLAATGITDETIISALRVLVNSFKTDLIWNKMDAIYPFVGGTADTTKYNLKDSADTDAAFRLTQFGGWVYSANGVLPNGTNAYVDTHLSPSAVQTFADSHFSLYSRTLGTSTTLYGGSGIRGVNGNPASSITMRQSNNGRFAAMWNEGTGGLAIATAETDARGFYLMNRTATNILTFYKNSVQIAQNTDTNSATLPTDSYFLSVLNQAGSPFSTTYDNKELAFSTIGSGLSNAEQINLYNAIQVFQTTLGRNV